jgi:hypothetical protein
MRRWRMREKDRMKKIHWYSSLEPEVRDKEFHTIFHFDKDIIDRLSLKEPIQLTVGDPGEPVRHFGLAEVVSIKQCSIRDIEPYDFERQKPGFRTRKETIETFRRMKPEYRSDINLNTEIVVITIRRFDYNLGRLNTVVNRKRARDAEREKKMGS